MRHLAVLTSLLGLITLLSLSYKSTAPTPYSFPRLNFFPPMPVNKDNPVTEEGVSLGRFLFYDPIISVDSSMSCSSCHRQEKAFSDSPIRFSTGVSGAGANRNTLPLFNLAWYPSLFWDGRAVSIEEQVFQPVKAHDELGLDWAAAEKRIAESRLYRAKFKEAFGDKPIDSTLIARAIAQFERTLISHQSKYDRVLNGKDYFTHDEYQGFILMNDQTKGDCLHCHTTDSDPLGTTGGFSNNGLDPVLEPTGYRDKGRAGITRRKRDLGLFKIPSLRNVAVTAPYMHDGRFTTLGEVLDFYSKGVNPSINVDSKMGSAHQGGVRLSPDEKLQIIAFLKTLTDSVFLTNTAHGNPFISGTAVK